MKSIKILMATVIILFASIANAQSNTSINKVLTAYIQLKDALVKSDVTVASNMAKTLLSTMEEVKMSELNTNTHAQWMKFVKDLKDDAEHISETKEITHQRDHFMALSKNLYAVMKESKSEIPIFYQFCPMANKGKGANWLSLESKIKNPYYGNQMLTCGKVVDTIQ
jgi:GTPase Era involved in 16S rRNA processing